MLHVKRTEDLSEPSPVVDDAAKCDRHQHCGPRRGSILNKGVMATSKERQHNEDAQAHAQRYRK